MSGQSAKTLEDIEAEILLIQQQAQSEILLVEQQAQSQVLLIQQMAEAQIELIQQQRVVERPDEDSVAPDGGRERVLASPDTFRIIMLMVGLDSLDDLHRCRRVCRKWDEDILSLVWGSEGSRRIMKERIEKRWGPGLLPSNEDISHARWLESKGILDTVLIKNLTERVREMINGYRLIEVELKCAASLAQHGLLGSLGWLGLFYVDLSPVPAKQLASLVSSVTGDLNIDAISGDLTSLLASIKCEYLAISKQSLDGEETRALVRAMDSGVERVNLRGVKLDIEALTAYSGHGECRELTLWKDDLSASIEEEVRNWASRRNWRVGDFDQILWCGA